MARKCVKCDKKISFGDKNVHLVYSNVRFCADCGREVNDLLNPIRIASDKEKADMLKTQFKTYLSQSSFDDRIRRYIQDEFEYITMDRVYSVLEPEEFTNDPTVVKHFKASFEDCYEIFEEYSNKFGISTVKAKVINPGNVRVTTFVVDRFSVIGSEQYVTFVINLVYFKGITTVVTIASQSPYGVSATCGSVLSSFWLGMRQNYPEFMKLEIGEEEFIEMDNVQISNVAEKEPLTVGGIGIFGGTFDPIHKGHVTLARAAIDELNLTKLVVMPARVQPFKAGKRVTEDYHRENMVKLAFEGVDKVEVSDYELNNIGISYTYQTLRHVKEIYPGEKIYFILGADSMLELDTWYRGKELLQNYSFAVSVRPGYDDEKLNKKIEEYKREYNADIYRLQAAMPDISSTQIREGLAGGGDVSSMIPESVERYINKNGLYR